MFERHSQGVYLVQNKEPAFSRDILTFVNNKIVSESFFKAPENVDELTADEIIEIARTAEIVDERDGRALYKKLIKAKGKFSRIVMDAMDDEPYVSSQMAPMFHLADEATGGLKLLAKVFNNSETVIFVYKNLNDLNINIPKIINDIPVEGVGGRYPIEHGALLNIRSDDLVIGACALIHLYRAVTQGRKQTTCFVTVSGDCIANPRNLEVSKGMSVDSIMERCGLIDIPQKVIVGGPMTGTSVIDTETTKVTTTTRAIIVMKHDNKNVPTICIGCGRCVECCPVNLSPMHIYKAAKRNFYNHLKMMDYYKCIGCGTCSYVCPAKLDLSNTIYALTERFESNEND
ncbi:MAG: 4Fe-4S dicluster domain-containing protein [Oscillospiraceae bacterium]|nr:4Fe-4S dicluster domain-containing protein [Oscillospiraceae bacterium]